MRAIVLTLLLMVSGTVSAQLPPVGKDVEPKEAIRRGNMVVHVTDNMEDNDPSNLIFAQVMAPPTNDSNKWHIAVVTRKNCEQCATLMKQWESDKILRAYAVPGDPQHSWAHLTVYDYNDKMENWRWQPFNKDGLKIDAFPTVLVLPPRDGSYGKPNIVVCKYVYEGTPEALRDAVNGSIKAYIVMLDGQVKPRSNNTQGVAKFKQEPNKEVEEPVEGGIGSLQGGFGCIPISALLAFNAMSQLQVPPLNLPNEESEPNQPVVNTLKQAIGKGPEVLVIRDTEVQQTGDEEKQIKDMVSALQPRSGSQYSVRYKDVNKVGKQYGISAEECPVVLQVDGKRVVQKLSAIENGRNKEGMGFWILLDTLFGGGALIGAILFVAKALVVLVLVVLLLAVIMVMINRSNHTVVTQPAAPVDQAAIAAAVAAELAKQNKPTAA